MEIPTDLRIDLGPTAEAVERARRGLTELIRAIEDPGREALGLEWTVGQLAAHLVARTGLLATFLTGEATPQGETADIAAENDRMLRELEGRSMHELAGAVEANVTAFVGATRGCLGSDPFPWYSGLTLDVATGAGILLTELQVHAFDLARSIGARWKIPAAHARTILRASAVLAPRYVDPEAARGVSTVYRIDVRGGPRFRIAFDEGAASIEPAEGPADCTIHADPVALVLVAFGRRSRWWAIARGKLLASGRKPWRALAFDRLFLAP